MRQAIGGVLAANLIALYAAPLRRTMLTSFHIGAGAGAGAAVVADSLLLGRLLSEEQRLV